MHRHRHRRPPLADFINWTDYRWDAAPWQSTATAPQWGRARRHSGFSLGRVLLAALAVVVGAKLVSSLRTGGGSWARKGLYAALLLMVVAAVSPNRARRSRF